MRRHHPSPAEHIPVSMQICHQLKFASMHSDDDKQDWEIAAEAIDDWMRLHSPGAIPGPATAGVQWKRLFLPNGTLLRTVFDGKNHHCMVEGDALHYDGKAVSPSGFVNAVGGIRRNAWKCTWILFPNTKDWKLADTLRNRERPRRARKLAHTVPHDPENQSANARAPIIVPPSAVPPIVPSTAQRERVTPSAPEARHAQPSDYDRAPQPHAGDGGRRRWPRAEASLMPPGVMCGAAPRVYGDDRMTAFLQQELLPLLYQMCTRGGQAAPKHEPLAPSC